MDSSLIILETAFSFQGLGWNLTRRIVWLDRYFAVNAGCHSAIMRRSP